MKIFITGVAGFLGSHLAQKFLSSAFKVSGNDNLLGGSLDNVPEGVEFYNVDCCDNQAMVEVLQDVDIVIHCGATAHEGLSVFSPSFITKNIYEASVSVMSAAIQNNVRRFVFCSSMARYGSNIIPFIEEQAPAPVDPYGIAKVAAEDTLKVLCDTHDMEYNIAIPHNIIGPKQNYTDPYRNVISIMANRNLRGLPSMIYGDGMQERCFSYVDDCVSCLEKMALDKNIVGETINIGPDEHTITINEAAEIVARECMFQEPAIHLPDRPREVKHATCSSNKARRLLDYETKTDLTTAIQKTVEYIRETGPKEFNYNLPLEIINDKTPTTWKDELM